MWLGGATPLAAELQADQPFTLRDLEQEPDLTPSKFADLFEDFEFRFLSNIQSAESFLRSRSGDCDDYAALAEYVLGKRGYTARIVQVRLVGSGIDHAVCYVDEKRVYLDYNNRKFTFNLERSRPYLRDIAQKVADSLERNWTVVYEFSYSYTERRKHTRHVVVKTADPSTDTDRKPSTNRPK
jgi:hypothetical protein